MIEPGGELVHEFPVCKMWVRNQTVTNGKYSLEFCRQQVEEMFHHRDIDVIDAYYEQLALYIHKKTKGPDVDYNSPFRLSQDEFFGVGYFFSFFTYPASLIAELVSMTSILKSLRVLPVKVSPPPSPWITNRRLTTLNAPWLPKSLPMPGFVMFRLSKTRRCA
ncbi:hypothetical protein SPFM12_00289 [Salmonella phage SPFM12]|nr:hypothetical protein SPFM12_00289 [Salmonella phage SPFM12]